MTEWYEPEGDWSGVDVDEDGVDDWLVAEGPDGTIERMDMPDGGAMLSLDADGDGDYEALASDFDGDGRPDIVQYDGDGDGSLESIQIPPLQFGDGA